MKLPLLCLAILAGSSVRPALASQAYVSLAGPGGSVSLFDYTGGPATKTYATPRGAVDLVYAFGFVDSSLQGINPVSDTLTNVITINTDGGLVNSVTASGDGVSVLGTYQVGDDGLIDAGIAEVNTKSSAQQLISSVPWRQVPMERGLTRSVSLTPMRWVHSILRRMYSSVSLQSPVTLSI